MAKTDQTLDLDVVEKELDPVIFQINYRGHTIDVPNPGRLGLAATETLYKLQETGKLKDAIAAAIPGKEGRWLADHITVKAATAFLTRWGEAAQTLAPTPGE